MTGNAPKLSAAGMATLKQMWERGRPRQLIAKALGLNESSVYRIAAKNGWQRPAGWKQGRTPAQRAAFAKAKRERWTPKPPPPPPVPADPEARIAAAMAGIVYWNAAT